MAQETSTPNASLGFGLACQALAGQYHVANTGDEFCDLPNGGRMELTAGRRLFLRSGQADESVSAVGYLVTPKPGEGPAIDTRAGRNGQQRVTIDLQESTIVVGAPKG